VEKPAAPQDLDAPPPVLDEPLTVPDAPPPVLDAAAAGS